MHSQYCDLVRNGDSVHILYETRLLKNSNKSPCVKFEKSITILSELQQIFFWDETALLPIPEDRFEAFQF